MVWAISDFTVVGIDEDEDEDEDEENWRCLLDKEEWWSMDFTFGYNIESYRFVGYEGKETVEEKEAVHVENDEERIIFVFIILENNRRVIDNAYNPEDIFK